MAVQSREDLTTYEIYRPVKGGLGQFMDHVRFHGEQEFGAQITSMVTEPEDVETGSGETERVMLARGIGSPRLETYNNGQLRLPLVELRTIPGIHSGGKFNNADRRIFNNPEDSGVRSQDSPGPNQDKTQSSDLSGLEAVLERIGYKYDIMDQSSITVPCRTIDIPTDPLLEHLGLEVVLVPDPKAPETRMLAEHIGVCIRALIKKNKDLVLPNSPTSFRIPFARLPVNATTKEIDRFMSALEEDLPKRVALGGIRSSVDSPPPRKKQEQ